jgi:glycosyltransferase involved in cell wall biosynthesis
MEAAIMDDSKTKILFVLPALTPGGAERVLITLMNGLQNTAFAPEMLSVRGDGALRVLIHPDIPFHSLDHALSPRALPQLYNAIKRIKPEIIVSTMAHMNFALLALRPFFPRTRFIVREAITPSFFFKKHKAKAFIIKRLYKWLYPLADTVLSPTQTVFEEFKTVLNMHSAKFVVLPNPVDVEGLRAQIDLSIVPPTHKDTIRFVSCGRLHPQKGFDRLIECLGKMDMSADWRLDILGEGDERENLLGLIEKYALKENVFLRGHVYPPYSYMAAGDCFLLPSRFEGSPNVVLESLACGTPVIAMHEAGGIAEIQKNTGEYALKIAKTMSEFGQYVQETKKHTGPPEKPSHLSERYQQQAVLEQFKTILKSQQNLYHVPHMG